MQLEIPAVLSSLLLCAGCLLIFACKPTNKFANCTATADSYVIDTAIVYIRENRHLLSSIDYIIKERTIDRRMDVYNYLLQHIHYYQNAIDTDYNPIPLPEGTQVDFDYTCKHLRDTVLISDRDTIMGLPVLSAGGYELNQAKLYFAPLLPTTDPKYSLLMGRIVTLWDTPRFILVINESEDGYTVKGDYWDDGPTLYFPIEDDLLEQEYQRRYGQSGK